MSMGWDYVSELWPPVGLLFILQMIYEYGEPWWNDIGSVNPKSQKETCPSAILSTSHIYWLGHELRPPQWEASH
jgi:hypothetical protein